MPVNIPRDLPARATLEAENVFVMSDERATAQDIRPLRIAIVNLMPTKIATETHLLRLLGNTPIQLEITLLHMGSHASQNTPPGHLDAFYATFDEVRGDTFDGLVITGAPVELLPFEDVAAAKRATLLATLQVWLVTGGDRAGAADLLGVHPQTVTYRVARLRDLLGEALDDPERRLEMIVALAAAGWPPPTTIS